MTVLWDGHQTRRENIRGVYLVTLGVKWYWALIRFAGAVSSCPLELRLIRPALQVTANPHQRIFFFFFCPYPGTLLSDPVCNTGTEVTPYGCVRKRWTLFEFSIKPQLAARVLVWNRHSASGGGCRDVPDSPHVSPGVMGRFVLASLVCQLLFRRPPPQDAPPNPSGCLQSLQAVLLSKQDKSKINVKVKMVQVWRLTKPVFGCSLKSFTLTVLVCGIPETLKL